MGVLRERDQSIATLEAEIAEVISKLNLLQNEKGRLIQNEGVYKSDIADLKSELEAAKKALDKERVRSGQLEGKMGSLDQEKTFQIQLLAKQLEEEKKRKTLDLSAIDTQMKSEYEKRLRAELVKLRKMYEDETEKAKKEFMYIHSNKLTELQEALTKERSGNGQTRAEFQGVLERLEQYKRNIGRLENDKLSLEQTIADLQAKLEEQGQSFRAQHRAMESEVKVLLKEIKDGKKEYEQLVEIRLALEMEINTYRNILEDEEKRISRVSRKFTKNISRGKIGKGLGQGSGSSPDSSDVEDRESSSGYRSVDMLDGSRPGKASYSSYTTSTVRKGRI